MGFTLENIVPWGRSFAEYVAMFDLSEHDLKMRILGCGDGPAAFNAELTHRGGNVVSVDPVYAFSAAQISSRIDDTYVKVMAQLRKNASDYVWTSFVSPDDVGKTRMAAMQSFLADYETGRAAGRYIDGDVLSLPFTECAFDLALVSHFLFMYAEQLSPEFHLHAFTELLRVAKEVRVFPILTLDGKPYPHFDLVLGELKNNGFSAKVKTVPYEFQKGGNEMLVIKRME